MERCFKQITDQITSVSLLQYFLWDLRQGHAVLRTNRAHDSKVHGANIGPIWGRQDPGGPHVGPMNFAIWGNITSLALCDYRQRYLRKQQNKTYLESKVHGANMGPIWGPQDPGGLHVGPMNFAIWVPMKQYHPQNVYNINLSVAWAEVFRFVHTMAVGAIASSTTLILTWVNVNHIMDK